jgi:hypothetical protein
MFNAISGGPYFHFPIICLSVDSTDPSIIRSVSLESHLHRFVFGYQCRHYRKEQKFY